MLNIRVIPAGTPMVHVRFDGRSYTIPATELNVDVRADDAAIRRAMGAYFDVAVEKFAFYVVERYANGNITVRPEAVFG